MPDRPFRFRLATMFGLVTVFAISFGSWSRGPSTFFFVSTFLLTSFTYWFSYRDLRLTSAAARRYGLIAGTAWGAVAVAMLSAVRDQTPLGNLFVGAVLGAATALIPLACVSVLRENQHGSMPMIDESYCHNPGRPEFRTPGQLLREAFFSPSMHRDEFVLAPSVHRRKFTRFDLIRVLISLAVVTGVALYFNYNLFVIGFSLAVSAAVCYLARARWKFARSDTVWLAPLAGAAAGMFLFLFDEALAMERRFGAVDYRKGAVSGALASLVVIAYFCGVRRQSKRDRGRHRRRRSAPLPVADMSARQRGSRHRENQPNTQVFDRPTQ